jgi:hypothetical protein
MSYTPVAATGSSPGATVYSDTVRVNKVPVGNKAKITGTSNVNQTISSIPGYSDNEGDNEGASVYQWFRSATQSDGYTEIVGANTSSYLLTLSDTGYYLYMSYTPVAATGSSPGATVYSDTVRVNKVPVGNKAKITGVANVNQTISSIPGYSDNEGDKEGASIYQWYRSATTTGSYAAIIGANKPGYLITLSDKDYYLYMSYTPVAATGSSPGATIYSDTVLVKNTPPTGTLMKITGIALIGQTIKADTTYYDLEADAPGVPKFQWFRSLNRNGGYTLVETALSSSHTIVLSDKDCYLYLAYTPVALTGKTTGTVVYSDTILVINSSPTATNIVISGTQVVCKTLIGKYTYNDIEGDKQGVSTFRWLRSNTYGGAKTPIAGATDSIYLLTKNDKGKYIYFEVTPIATTGTNDGTAFLSSSTGSIINLLPTVTFSGGGAICQGKSLNITLSFTGTPPYNLTYTDSINNFILNTDQSIYNLTVSKAGSYKGILLTDNLNCPVTEPDLTSSAKVVVNALPAVDIVGLNNAYSVNSSSVLLTGKPSGGLFSGPGVVPSVNTFYPSIAGVPGSPHSIVYTYTAPLTGCVNSDTVKVSIFNANALITGIRSAAKYCNYDPSFLITGINVNNVVGSFSISGGVGLSDNGNNTATITPLLLKAGTYTISYVYFDNVAQTITSSITIEQVEQAQILGLSKFDYCKNDNPITLLGNYTSGVFSGNGVIKSDLNLYYYEPSKSNIGKNTIYYKYSTTYGCVSTDSAIMNILSLPRLQFDLANNCWNGDASVFVNISEPVDSIFNWQWNFGDNTVSTEQNTSKLKNPTHTYTSAGNKTIQLVAQNILSCRDTLQKTIHLGSIPKVDFTWDKECFVKGQEVSFSNLTVNADPIDAYKWIIRDTAYTSTSMKYKFPVENDYPIKLFATSTYNCSGSAVKTFFLRPIHVIKDSVYFNDFEVANKKWYTVPNQDGNWQWMTPNGSSINKAQSGTKSYYTQFNGTRKNQQIAISSQCFDFTGVKKPYIELWINSDAVRNTEGAVLQYISDDSTTWKTIGNLNTGVNWYSGNTISSSPGGQTLGWTGKTNGWIQARHNLDSLRNTPNIKFRIVYGENAAASASDGFAFDNVFIGQRSKTVLFEHFTNSSLSDARAANVKLYNVLDLAGNDAVSIQYHTSVPGLVDSLNLNNQADPSARALSYGFDAIPTCILDGGTEAKYIYNFTTVNPSIGDVNIRSLRDPVFDLEVIATHKKPNINGKVTVRALNSFIGHKLSLYVAVVEDIIIQEEGTPKVYYNVLRKLLPSNGGYSFKNNWSVGMRLDTSFSWTYQKVYDPKKVKIVAFMQDDESKEVYQAISILTEPITGIPSIYKSDIWKAHISPNPVSNIASITFDSPLNKAALLRVYSNKGSLVKSLSLYRGISSVEMDESDLPNGLYLVQIIMSPSEILNLKMVVVH